MTTRDQLEIIGPGGDIRFHSLDPVKGFTNIGSHPDNDIVIASPDVAAFQAVLDHRQRPCQIINMGRSGPIIVAGQTVKTNGSHVVNNWDTIELNGHTIVLMEGVAGGVSHPAPAAFAAAATPLAFQPSTAPVPTPAASAATHSPAAAGPAVPVSETPDPPVAEPPVESAAPEPTFLGVNAPFPDQTDEFILTEITARDFTLEVDQTATFDVTVINGGPLVASFEFRVDGLDPLWVAAPASVNLYEGERQTVSFSITPPRSPHSRAGMHYFAVVVTSPELPGNRSQVGCTLTVNPYYDHSVTELSPRQQKLNWFKRSGKVTYAVVNRGNSETGFRLDANDDERILQFEFKLEPKAASLAKQAELRLQPEQTRQVEVLFNSQKRTFFGFANQLHTFTVTTSPLQGTLPPRSLLGQLENAPLIGPLHVFLALLLAALLIAVIFRPSIADVTAQPGEIISGQEVTMRWQASAFADITLDHDLGSQGRGDGEITLAPLENTTYLVTASTPFLGNLIPFWFTTSEVESIIVDPLYPIVRVSVSPDQITAGETAQLNWEIYNADEAVLIINGALQSIEPEQFVGSLAYTPEGGGDAQVTFEIRASNRYDSRSDSAVLNAIAPTPTPWPRPVIVRFDALPGVITAGEEVTLEWNVSGAEKVRLDPGGQEFPPIGKVVLKPEQSTPYTLTAINGPVESVAFREVIVNPAPTPTPIPGTPIIEVFTGTPLEVSLGSADADNIQLAWAVTGDMTDLQLTGDTIGTISGLPREGIQVVAAGDEDTKFTLTAFNGELESSQTLEIAVVVPVPIISSLSPASTTNVGGSGFNLTVSGANFVDGSTVRWNGSDRATTFLSTTSLIASITSADIAEAGTAQIVVFNPTEAGGGESGAATFYINNPVPVLLAIDPATTEVGSGDVTVVLSGASFVEGSTARWNGVDVTTTYNGPATLTAVITKDKFETAGTATLSVFTPKPGGGTSGALVFTIENPVPTITSLGPPSFIYVGSDTFTLTINGTGFVGGSNSTDISWDGVPRTANFISQTQLQLVVPAEDVALPGTVEVSAINDVPGGGPSDPVNFEVRRAPVNISLSGSPANGVGVSGQPLTFIAVVSPAGSTPYVPSGAVTFMNGAATLGTGFLSGNPATASIGNIRLAAGTYDITAVYGGDTNYAEKTSPIMNYAVSKANPTVSVSAAPNPGTLGSAVTLTAVIGAASPGSIDPALPGGGEVQFLLNGVPLGSPQGVSNGLGTLAIPDGNSAFVGGSQQITANYNGASDPNFNSGTTSSGYLLQMDEIQPLVTVSAPTINYLQNASFKAVIASPVAGYTPAIGSIVTFKRDGAFIDNAVTTSPSVGDCPAGQPCVVASLSNVSGLTPGNYTISAEFEGASDSNFKSSSGSTTLVVLKAASTTATPVLAPSISVYGTSVFFTTTVTGSAFGELVVTGTVSFYYGPVGSGTFICSDVSPFDGGTAASCSATHVPAPSQPVYAVFSGNSLYETSTSGTTTLTVNEAVPNMNFYFMSPSNTTYGNTVSFQAQVHHPQSSPSGTVTFRTSGGLNICTAALGGTIAACSSNTIPAGVHSVQAYYNGEDSNFLPAGSGFATLTITSRTPGIVINACPTPTANNAAYTYTITLSGAGTAPAGTVTFLYQTHYPTGLPVADFGYTYSQAYTVTVPSAAGTSVSVSNSSFVWVTTDKRSRVTFTFNPSNSNYTSVSTSCIVDGP